MSRTPRGRNLFVDRYLQSGADRPPDTLPGVRRIALMDKTLGRPQTFAWVGVFFRGSGRCRWSLADTQMGRGGAGLLLSPAPPRMGDRFFLRPGVGDPDERALRPAALIGRAIVGGR